MQDDQDQVELRVSIARLRQEHEDMKVAIDAMIQLRSDPLCVQRMKKKKLELKDRLERLSSRVIPDIIA